MMKNYKCHDCGKTFRFGDQPTFCPFCGGKEVVPNIEKARETSLRLIAECNSISRNLENLWQNYLEQYVVYEDKMQTLRVYKKRGIISEEELPVFQKRQLQAELSAYRKSKKAPKEVL